eukprot:6285041-Pyramimonas_sp.AAC.2
MEDYDAEFSKRNAEMELERFVDRYVNMPLEQKQRFYEAKAEERQRKFKSASGVLSASLPLLAQEDP